jgi:hypothetical protein
MSHFPTLGPHTLEILQTPVDEDAALCKEEERQELEVRGFVRGWSHPRRRLIATHPCARPHTSLTTVRYRVPPSGRTHEALTQRTNADLDGAGLQFETLREEGKHVWYPGRIYTDPNQSDLDPVEDEGAAPRSQLCGLRPAG